MNRLLPSVLVLVVGIGIYASLGATETNVPTSPQQSDFSGKTVVFNHDGWSSTISEDVRLAVVGENSFLVFARPKTDTVQYDCWLPLNKISSIDVFDSMEDAIAHDKETSITVQ